jgi:Fe-S-cluster-containing dehydrogenase component
MSRVGLLIEYDYCTGCLSCEVACQQEHQHPVGMCGIKVTEFVLKSNKPLSIDYLPFPTDLCDLCAKRTVAGELPACVKHCQAKCMHYGPVAGLLQIMEKNEKTVLFRPR